MLERIEKVAVLRGVGLLYRRISSRPLGAYIRAIKTMLIVTACGLLPACAATPTTPTAGKPDDAYVKEAWAYFKNKCDTEAGEKIYKTFTGVKSVLVVKPLPPATEKDLYDQFWYGDPYSASATSARGESAARRLEAWEF